MQLRDWKASMLNSKDLLNLNGNMDGVYVMTKVIIYKNSEEYTSETTIKTILMKKELSFKHY